MNFEHEDFPGYWYKFIIYPQGTIKAYVYRKRKCFFSERISPEFGRSFDKSEYLTPEELVAAVHNWARKYIADAIETRREKEKITDLAKNTDWFVLDKLKEK